MKTFIAFLFTLTGSVYCIAQKTTYDLVTYIPPNGKGWKKENGNDVVSYTHINNSNKTWCRIAVFKSTASKGTIEADFESEWNELTSKHNSITAGPQKGELQEGDGWKFITGGGKASFDGTDIMIQHTVISGYNTCISIIAQTNSAGYLKIIEDFNGSIELKKPSGSNNNTNKLTTPAAHSNGFQFTSTNWDDGWVTYAKANWTEVTKANINVLIHYPNKQADAYNSVLKDGLQNAWNILVAPRYTNIRNYELKPIQSFESISFAEADATEKLSGKVVHIVLFRKHYSNGNGRYLEFVTPDKQTYEQEFGPYHNDEFGWDKAANMQYRNKFAVAANDLVGKWSASDYASLSYYYVNGGGFAGATATSIAHEFTFLNGGNYQSDHAGASGAVGNQQFSRQLYKGKFSADNWNMTLTNRFQGETETYNCYFEAVKGGRILILTDKHNTVYSLVKQ